MRDVERLAKRLGGVERVVPPGVRPAALRRGAVPLHDEAWRYDLKVDGARLLVHVSGGSVTLSYRTGRVCTSAYPELVDALAPLGDVVLDGEVFVVDAGGRPSFDRLGQRIRAPKPSPALVRDVPVRLAIFDVLSVGRFDVRRLSLLDRRRVLEALPLPAPLWRLPLTEDGVALARLCLEHHLEGLVAKRAASTYGEAGAWVKVKNEREDDFVVTACRRDQARVTALHVATYERGGVLTPRGVVEFGIGAHRQVLDGVLPGLEQRRTRDRIELRPELVVSVRYMTWTASGHLRFPVLRGVRHDVTPRACRARPPTFGRGAA